MESAFHQRLAEAAAAVEATLSALLGPAAAGGEIARPERLLAAMRYAALGPGKRLRPFLLAETARLFGRSGPGIWRAAAALECVHAYSLAHDDLPAMDDDDVRRGRPSLHRAFDEATAILAGDALLTLAFAILADPATDGDPAVRADLVLGLADAAGLGGMAGGQMLDLAGEGNPGDEAAIRLTLAMKTGALIRYAAEAGAVLGGADPGDRRRLRAFGERFGLAFQLADDLLDATGDASALNKPAGRDAARGKATLVALFGTAEAQRLLVAEVVAAEAELAPFGREADALRAAARFLLDRHG